MESDILEQFLNRVRDTGSTLHLWWRDDDAMHPNAALRRLCDILNAHAVPGHFAVIPETGPLGRRPDQAIAEFLGEFDRMRPLQHGYRHVDNAGMGRKKAEFGDDRSLEVALAEINAGRDLMIRNFGPQIARVFVPALEPTCASSRGLSPAGRRLGAFELRDEPC